MQISNQCNNASNLATNHPLLNQTYSRYTRTHMRGVQKVLQLDHKEEWKCYKLQFIFQYNHH